MPWRHKEPGHQQLWCVCSTAGFSSTTCILSVSWNDRKGTPMARCKPAVTPLLTHWGYHRLALSPRNICWSFLIKITAQRINVHRCPQTPVTLIRLSNYKTIQINVILGQTSAHSARYSLATLIINSLKQRCLFAAHHSDAIMTTMASQITSLTVVCSIVYSGADQRKHQSSALLAFVRGIHRWPVNSPHKGPVTRKMFPFDGVIMPPYHPSHS